MRRFIAILAILFSILLWGCPKTVPYPEEALQEYVLAVKAKDTNQIYFMLGDDLRNNMTEEEFATWFNENYVEIVEQAEEVEAVLKSDEGKPKIEATLQLDETNSASYVFENGNWYFSKPIPLSVKPGTEELREAALLFEQALGTRNLNTLFQVLSREHTETIEAELNILIQALQQSHDTDFSVEDNKAYLMLDNGIRITFIQEEGSWKIYDIGQDW